MGASFVSLKEMARRRPRKTGAPSPQNSIGDVGNEVEEDEQHPFLQLLFLDERVQSQLQRDFLKHLRFFTSRMTGSLLAHGVARLIDSETAFLMRLELEEISSGRPTKIDPSSSQGTSDPFGFGDNLMNYRAADNSSFVCKEVDLKSQLTEFLSTAILWSCNIFTLASLTEYPLTVLGYRVFRHFNFIETFNISDRHLINFFHVIEHGYNVNGNPYHNSLHAADVLQACFVLVDMASKHYTLTLIDLLSIVLACIVHDYVHPGLSNKYLGDTYGDNVTHGTSNGALESFHVSSALRVISTEECNIFANMNKNDEKVCRRLMRDLVLYTNLGKHFEFVQDFSTSTLSKRLKKEGLGEPFHLNPQESMTVLRCIIKAADLSNASRVFKVYDQWADAIMEEFYLQGDMERSMGLPISMFCDRENSSKQGCQYGFLSNIAAPLNNIVYSIIPECKRELRENFGKNLSHHTPIEATE